MIDTASLSRSERVVWTEWRAAIAVLVVACLATSWLMRPALAVAVWTSLVLIALVLRFPLVGFAALAFAVPWGSSTTVTMGSIAIGPSDILVGCLGFVLVVAVAQGRRSAASWNRWTGFVLLFVAAITLSATQAADWHTSLKEVIKWLELIVVFQAGVRLLSGKDIKWLAASVVAAGVSQAVLGYVQFAFQLGPEAFAHGAFLRAYGTFDQPNPYAGFLNMTYALSLSMSFAPTSARDRILYRVSTVAILFALFASQSRGALLATLLATSVVLACRFTAWRSGIGTAVVAFLGGAWLASFGLIPSSPFVRLLSAIGLGDVSFGNVNDANFSAVERAAHWLAGLRMFADHPLLGVGIGNYASAYPQYHPRGWYAPLAHAHDYYINIAAEAGVLGLIAYSLLAGTALWYSYAAMRRGSGTYGSAVALGVLGALVATDFHNVFDVLYVHGMVVLLGIFMTMAVLAATESVRLPQPEPYRGA